VLIGCRPRDGRLRIDVYDKPAWGIPQSKKRQESSANSSASIRGAKVARWSSGSGPLIVERIARVLDHTHRVAIAPRQGLAFSDEAPLGAALRATRGRLSRQRVDVSQVADMLVLCIDNEPKILDGMATLLGGWGLPACSRRRT
jgi:hypothetical protein